jgi:hypothetical protein
MMCFTKMYFLYVLCESERERDKETERESTYNVGVCFVFLQSVPFCLFVCGVFALNFVFQSFVKLCHDIFVAS